MDPMDPEGPLGFVTQRTIGTCGICCWKTQWGPLALITSYCWLLSSGHALLLGSAAMCLPLQGSNTGGDPRLSCQLVGFSEAAGGGTVGRARWAFGLNPWAVLAIRMIAGGWRGGGSAQAAGRNQSLGQFAIKLALVGQL